MATNGCYGNWTVLHDIDIDGDDHGTTGCRAGEFSSSLAVRVLEAKAQTTHGRRSRANQGQGSASDATCPRRPFFSQLSPRTTKGLLFLFSHHAFPSRLSITPLHHAYPSLRFSIMPFPSPLTLLPCIPYLAPVLRQSICVARLAAFYMHCQPRA
jgi:hypothetical protein